MSTFLATAVAALLAFSAAAAEQSGSRSSAVQYKAPHYMTEAQQAYQIGVWTFIMLLLIGYVGFYFVGTVDYSQDSLLHVEVEHDKHDE